jgi:hypothetical protein
VGLARNRDHEQLMIECCSWSRFLTSPNAGLRPAPQTGIASPTFVLLRDLCELREVTSAVAAVR